MSCLRRQTQVYQIKLKHILFGNFRQIQYLISSLIFCIILIHQYYNLNKML